MQATLLRTATLELRAFSGDGTGDVRSNAYILSGANRPFMRARLPRAVLPGGALRRNPKFVLAEPVVIASLPCHSGASGSDFEQVSYASEIGIEGEAAGTASNI